MLTKRARTWLGRGLLTTAVVLVAVLGFSTWMLAGSIDAALLRAPATTPQVEILALESEAVTLTAGASTTRPGVWGLAGESGSVVVGDIRSSDPEGVTRTVLGSRGDPGTVVRVSHTVWTDPGERGLPYVEVILEGPDGDLPAWVITGSDDTWVVFVHDFGADRAESLRVLPELYRLGLPVVVPALDGDGGGTGGRSDLGTGRWRQVAVAVDFAIGAGAHDVVLFGSGTGASAALLATAQARYDRVTAALVLDAPLLDPAADTDRRLAADRVPGFLVGWAKAVATFRFGVDWTLLDHVAGASHQKRPILVFHGDRDPRFGVESSRDFVAAARHATLVVVTGAGTGEAWNLDPARYEAALSGFLEETVVGLRRDPGS